MSVLVVLEQHYFQKLLNWWHSPFNVGFKSDYYYVSAVIEQLPGDAQFIPSNLSNMASNRHSVTRMTPLPLEMGPWNLWEFDRGPCSPGVMELILYAFSYHACEWVSNQHACKWVSHQRACEQVSNKHACERVRNKRARESAIRVHASKSAISMHASELAISMHASKSAISMRASVSAISMRASKSVRRMHASESAIRMHVSVY